MFPPPRARETKRDAAVLTFLICPTLMRVDKMTESISQARPSKQKCTEISSLMERLINVIFPVRSAK